MKKYSILFFLLFCMADISFAQSYNVSQLKGCKWVMDDNPNYYIRYTDIQEITTFLIDGKECNSYVDYYLSPEKTETFDVSKVGNSVDGKYIVTPNSRKGHKKGQATCTLISKLENGKLVIEYVEGAPYSFHRE